MLQLYCNDIVTGNDGKKIDKFEILLGADHGKGALTFMAALIIHFVDDPEPKYMDFVLGEIHCEQDSVDLLKGLVHKLMPSLEQLKPNTETGISAVSIVKDERGKYLFLFGEDNSFNNYDINSIVVKNTSLTFHLFGDYKFLFMALGRSGYDGAWCLYCTTPKTTWKKIHEDDNCNCNGELWSIRSLTNQCVLNQNNGNQGATGLGVREPPWFPFIPMTNVLFPLLHEILGVGNDLLANFRGWLDELVEPLTIEEQEAWQMAMMSEIDYLKSVEVTQMLDMELSELVDIRKEINNKRKDKSLSREEKEILKEKAATIRIQEVATRCNRDRANKKQKDNRALWMAAKKKEALIRSKRSRKDKIVFNDLEQELLDPKFNLHVSSYHGGD